MATIKGKAKSAAAKAGERKAPVRRSVEERALADFNRTKAAFERATKRMDRAEAEFEKASQNYEAALYEFSFFNDHPAIPDDMRVDLTTLVDAPEGQDGDTADTETDAESA